MKKIEAVKITKAVTELVKQASFFLRSDVLSALRKSYAVEKSKWARTMLKAILDNAASARKEKLAICQDTGLPVMFIQIGQDIVVHGNLKVAINKGVEQGYKKYYLRNSIISDPLNRVKPRFSPCIMHTDIVKGNKIKITFLPKGFGCENKSQLKMFQPTASIGEIKEFIIKAVKDAGPDACPPYVIGVGIGGTADYAGIMAKKALLRKISPNNSKLEKDLLRQINKTGIGPMGLGGINTVLAVHIQMYPTHIAGLPVSVNISCHALRSASVTL
ncbi:MAG: fumarate hydratase [Candidatus Omnitrophica bacterium]|nr:fumarate hydratase [Candidatus Omnitrophota bacterium]MBU1924178.1 fumarate hydratase [Candidatus Omnitrophota bacterium]